MSTTAKALTDEITVSIYLIRDTHENGMTLLEYADSVLAGTHDTLDHHNFNYQFGATQHNIDTVTNWATSHGLQVIEANSATSTVKVKGTVSIFNSQFGITLVDVTDDIRTYMNFTGTVTVPMAIAGVVERVLGFDQSFLATRNAVHVPLNATNPSVSTPSYSGAVTPQQVATAYNLPPGDGNGGCIGIFELTYSGYITGWSQTDVNNSFARVGLTPPSITNVALDGATISTTSDPESMMDIYCAGAVAPKAKIVYYDAPNGGAQYINDIINTAATDTVNKPQVLSISWGIGDGVQYDSAMAACVVKGITVIVSSGDYGARGSTTDSTSCHSPYAVIAGGTNIGITNGAKIGEYAWSGSGGGYSSSQTLPSWQAGLTYTTKNSSGNLGTPTTLPRRGIPDFSAPADPYTGYQFYNNGSLVQYGGTSASAPWLAGMIVRLNQLLGNRMGLPMPTLYSNSATAFTDITGGDNVDGYAIGYAATTGWDACTGLGVPNGAGLYNLLRSYLGISSTFPKQNYGFRPASGTTYPRRTSGVR